MTPWVAGQIRFTISLNYMGSVSSFLLAITGEEMNYTRSYVIESDSDNDYQEYINNVTGVVILGNQLIGKKH